MKRYVQSQDKGLDWLDHHTRASRILEGRRYGAPGNDEWARRVCATCEKGELAAAQLSGLFSPGNNQT